MGIIQTLVALCLAVISAWPAAATTASAASPPVGVTKAVPTAAAIQAYTSARPAALDAVRDPQQEGVLWFSQTGHTLRGGFRAYWEHHGGLAQFGYPLSEPFQEAILPGRTAYAVQYFQRNRFEWHPELAGTAHEYLLGLLGRDLTTGAVFPTSAPFGPTVGNVYFPETQHALGGAFLAYWQQHGGLPVYGYPISEEVLEQSAADGRVYLVQYFQRNRFELHPEHRGTPDELQLGLLGVDLLRSRGWLK